MGRKNSIKLSPKSRIKKAEQLRNSIYQDYINRLTEIALNVFEWTDLPDTIDVRYMELQLLTRGYCLYFNDDILGNLCLPCTLSGEFNVYQIPVERHAFSVNGYYADRTSLDSVLIFNNYLRTPGLYTIELFAEELTECKMASRVNTGNQKFPFLMRATQSTRLSILNAFEQVESDCPAIIVDKSFDPNDIQFWDLHPQFVGIAMHDYHTLIWNDFLTWCGVENSRQDKRERMTENEIGSNYGNVEIERDVRLNSRRQACDKINKMFGANIGVKYNSRLSTMLNKPNLLGDKWLETQLLEEPKKAVELDE